MKLKILYLDLNGEGKIKYCLYIYHKINKILNTTLNTFEIYQTINNQLKITENDFNNYTDGLSDKYNIPGYLIYRDKYYIFQPLDLKYEKSKISDNRNKKKCVKMIRRNNSKVRCNLRLSLAVIIKNTSKKTSWKNI